MQTKDEFRRWMKYLCPRSYARKKSKRHVWGCMCCWYVPNFKRFVRKQAKVLLKQQDQNDYREYYRILTENSTNE